MVRPRVVALVACFLSFASRVHAQDLPAGTFQVAQDQTTVQIPEWGTDCGPRPESHTGSTGRAVQVTASGGQLAVADGRRTLRTDGCWSDNPRLQRVSATHAGSTWTITCTTPQSDYQQEQGTYTVTSSGDRITMRESGSYSWQLRGSRCRASATRTLAYARVGPAPPPAVDAAVATHPPPPVNRCASPGAPTRLEIAPSRRALASGGRACFRARVLDANGCDVALGARAPTWQLTRTGGTASAQDAVMDAACVRAPAGSPVADYAVVATLDALSGRAVASVVSVEELQSLIAQHIEDDDAGLAAPTAGPAPGTGVGAVVVHAPAPASSEPGGPGVIVLLLVGAAVVLGAGGVALLTRRRRAPVASDTSDAPGERRQRRDAVALPNLKSNPDVLASPVVPSAAARAPAALVKRCPTCNQRFAAEMAFCPEHGTALVDVDAAAPPAPAPTPPVAIAAATVAAQAASPAPVCPTCNLPVEGGSRFCPRDGTDVSAGAKPLRCPVCNRRFAIGTAFCGEDGSPLVTG